MPRKRMIDPGIWRSEQVNTLPRDARLLFIGMFSNADDAGRLHGSARFLKATIFPYDDDVTSAVVGSWRDEVIRSGLVVLYTNGGHEYLYLPTWRRHQRIDRPSESVLPSPEDSTSDLSIVGDDSTNARRGLDEDSPPIEYKVNEDKTTQGNSREVKVDAPDGASTPGNIEDMTPLEEALRDLKAWGKFTVEDRAWVRELLHDYPGAVPPDVRDMATHWVAKTAKHSKGQWKARFRSWVHRKEEFAAKDAAAGAQRRKAPPGNDYDGCLGRAAATVRTGLPGNEPGGAFTRYEKLFTEARGADDSDT